MYFAKNQRAGLHPVRVGYTLSARAKFVLESMACRTKAPGNALQFSAKFSARAHRKLLAD
jgi:hypothetical protein